MKKIAKSAVLIIWLCISIFEITTYILVSPKPIYWRAWEAVSNYTGKDASIAPFKPLYVYDGTMTGDLLIGMGFKPLPTEVRKQEFVVDEYGYRNRPGFLKNKIDAIVIGSSFVGGGQETQKNLVSEILTNTYKVSTYNSTTSVQYFWEDGRFIKNKPQYVIFLGSEGEIINSLWKYSITGKSITETPKAWNSYNVWRAENEKLIWKYDKIADNLKNYSLTRFFINKAYISTLNTLFSREQLVSLTTQDVITYDPDTKVLFWQEGYDIPLINTPGKTEKDIELAIKELLHTKKLLESRNITFIVAGMPSKTHIELKKYRDVSDEKRALSIMNKAMEKAGIEYIDLLNPSRDFVSRTNQHLYYPDDSHWNTAANQLISSILKKKMDEIETRRERE